MARGHKTGGRTKGTPNKSTTDIGAVCRKLVDSETYQANFKKRFEAGECAPGVEQMVWHYGYGKPAEHLELTGEDGGPVLVRFVEVNAPA